MLQVDACLDGLYERFQHASQHGMVVVMWWHVPAGDGINLRADDSVLVVGNCTLLLLPAPAQHQLCARSCTPLFRRVPDRYEA